MTSDTCRRSRCSTRGSRTCSRYRTGTQCCQLRWTRASSCRMTASLGCAWWVAHLSAGQRSAAHSAAQRSAAHSVSEAPHPPAVHAVHHRRSDKTCCAGGSGSPAPSRGGCDASFLKEWRVRRSERTAGAPVSAHAPALRLRPCREVSTTPQPATKP